MPLKGTSADRAALDYQRRLNSSLPRLLRDAEPHPQLLALDYFREFWGPSGICPVQLMGYLHSGEFVYFRARGRKVSLSFHADADSEPFRTFECSLDYKHELGTGALPVEICVSYIKDWLREYLQK